MFKRVFLSILAVMLVVSALMVSGAFSANQYTQITTHGTDSLVTFTTSYAAVDSLTITIDSAKREALLMVSGEIELGGLARGYLAVSQTACSTWLGIKASETLYTNTIRQFYSTEYQSNGGKSRLPFFFQLPIDTDSTGQALKFYLNAKKLNTSDAMKIYNLRFDALVNLRNDSI